MFIRPETVPVDRLLNLARAAITAAPKSAEAHYTAARIHYLAFVCATDKLEAHTRLDGSKLPTVGPRVNFTEANDGAMWEEAEKRVLRELKLQKPPDYAKPMWKRYWERKHEILAALEKTDWRNGDLPDAKAVEHIGKAIDHFQTADNLDGKNALHRLGYASLLEQAVAWSKRHPKVEVPEEVRAATPAAIRAEYLKAWRMELKADLKEANQRGMFSAMDMVSYEAGKAFVRLAEKDKLNAAEQNTLVEVRRSLKELEAKRGLAMTPLIFATRPVAGIDELLAPEKTVNFPLRGYGPAGRWQWVRPDTALLVWNPSGSGHIASGAQLFGGYTWELFWKSGYDALAVLDADGDGVLRGDELRGLAVWFDRDSDGVSGPGEVVPISALGVTELATRALTMEGPHPMNPRGVTFSDGRTLPTWDWMAEPAKELKPRATSPRSARPRR